MTTILRNISAVVLGFLLGSMANMALVVAGPKVIPTPAGVDASNAESLAAGMHLLEPKHFLFPFLAHALGTLVGTLVAHLAAASRRSTLAYVVGGLFFLGGVVACLMIPAPGWFKAADLLVAYLPMAWLGTRLGGMIRPATATGAV